MNIRSTEDLMIDCRIKLEGSLYIIGLIKDPSTEIIVNKIVIQSALNTLDRQILNK